MHELMIFFMKEWSMTDCRIIKGRCDSEKYLPRTVKCLLYIVGFCANFESVISFVVSYTVFVLHYDNVYS